MKIAMMNEVYDTPNGGGGVTRTYRYFTDYCIRKNIDLEIFVLTKEKVSMNKPYHLEQKGSVKIHRFYPSSAIYVYHDFKFSLNPKDIQWRYNYFKNNHFDLIHTIGPTFYAFESSFLSRRFDIPLLAFYHTHIPEFARERTAEFLQSKPKGDFIYWLAWKYMGPLYWFSDLILVPSEPFKKLISEKYNAPIEILSRGIDREVFNPKHRTRKKDAKPLSILYVGRISIEKNVKRLARILSHYQNDKRVQIDIVGDGPELDYLKSQVKANYHGFLHGKQLSQAYANADIFLFPSDNDTLGNVILEAMASELPVIVSSKGGPSSLVSQGKNGYICHYDKEFIQAIEDLINNPEKRSSMGKEGKAYTENFNWETTFDRLIGYYERLIEEHHEKKNKKQAKMFQNIPFNFLIPANGNGNGNGHHKHYNGNGHHNGNGNGNGNLLNSLNKGKILDLLFKE